MQRYFVANDQLNESSFVIAGEDVKHITKVMRMTAGDEIICINDDGQVVRCLITVTTADEVRGEIVETLSQNTELPVKVIIAQGLPKGDKLDLIVQKGTELGAYGFIPFQAGRSIVKWDDRKSEKKIERLEKIAKEAAEQSYRNYIPKILKYHSFQQLIKGSDRFSTKIVAFEEQAKKGELKNLVTALNAAEIGSSILLVVGPEGGLTEQEVEALQKVGFVVCSFGPRILRTETAPLYFLAAVSYHFEMLR